MKPMSIIHKDIAYTKRSLDTGKAVAQLIKKHGLENRVFLASFDPVKTWAAKQENPNLVIGSFFLNSYWKQDTAWYSDLKCQLKLLPGLKTCFDSLPDNKTTMDFLFMNGSMSKAVKDSFLDIHFEIFKEGIFNISSLNMIRENYNKNISLGSSTIYDMKLNENQTQDTEQLVQSLINAGVERLFTDNVTRLREKLGREKPSAKTTSNPTTNPSTTTTSNPMTNPSTPTTSNKPIPHNNRGNYAANKNVCSILLFLHLLVTFSLG